MPPPGSNDDGLPISFFAQLLERTQHARQRCCAALGGARLQYPLARPTAVMERLRRSSGQLDLAILLSFYCEQARRDSRSSFYAKQPAGLGQHVLAASLLGQFEAHFLERGSAEGYFGFLFAVECLSIVELPSQREASLPVLAWLLDSVGDRATWRDQIEANAFFVIDGLSGLPPVV